MEPERRDERPAQTVPVQVITAAGASNRMKGPCPGSTTRANKPPSVSTTTGESGCADWADQQRLTWQLCERSIRDKLLKARGAPSRPQSTLPKPGCPTTIWLRGALQQAFVPDLIDVWVGSSWIVEVMASSTRIDKALSRHPPVSHQPARADHCWATHCRYHHPNRSRILRIE
jgi:hypothetical protein